MKHTDETKAKIRETLKRKYEDPEYHKMISERTKAGMTDVVKEKISTGVKAALQNPEIYDRFCKAMQEVSLRPEVRKQRSETNLGRKYSAEICQKHSDVLKERYKDPEAREKMRKSTLEIWSRPGHREKVSQSCKIAYQNPALLRIHRENSSRMWSKKFDTDTVDSIGEREVRKFFQTTFPNDGWTKGGCFSVGKYPDGVTAHKKIDCYSNKLKVMIEYDGSLHFIDSWKYKVRLTEPRFKDNLLNMFCFKNGWKMIRVSDSFYLGNRERAKKLLVDAVYKFKERSCWFGKEYRQQFMKELKPIEL